MNLLLVLVNVYSIIVCDEILPYTIEQGVPSFTEYISTDHVILEQIDDDKVKVGGYFECIKSMDPKLPLQFAARSQYLHQSSWREGPLRIVGMDVCPELVNPSRFYYNITKLWTNCPPQNGDKWFVETQIVDLTLDLPPSIAMGNWRFHILYTQGLFGIVTKFGAMVSFEFIYI